MKAQMLTLGLVFVLMVPGSRAADPNEDKDKLKGAWTLVGVEEGGERVQIKENTDRSMKLLFAGNKFTAERKDKRNELTYKLNGASKPKTIDLTPVTGFDKGKTYLGIYELEGDELKLCFAEPEVKERP